MKILNILPFILMMVVIVSGCININMPEQPTGQIPIQSPPISTQTPAVTTTQSLPISTLPTPIPTPPHQLPGVNLSDETKESYDDFTNNAAKDRSLDSDGDGIPDYDEINGYTRDNIIYYTDPLQKSTDFDPYNDYKEISTIDMDPSVKFPGRHPLVPSYPDLKIDLEKIDINTLTKITSTDTHESGWSWYTNMETIDTTKQDWGVASEIKAGFSGWSFSPYGEVKVSAYYDYSHTSISTSTYSSSGWGRDEWSTATAIDTDKAARLKFHLKIRNDGTDTAKNVRLKFNVKIGDNIISTINTDEISDRIDPGAEMPINVVERDSGNNDITVTLNELRSIDLGAPITIEIIEINAKVPWMNGAFADWNDYKAMIDGTSTKIILDTGNNKVKEYRVFSGIRYPAQGNSYYFTNITIGDAIKYTLGAEQKTDGIYIGGDKVEDWRFGFDNNVFPQVKNYIISQGPLLKIPIKQGWTIIMKSPDKLPPKIYWAAYTKDGKGIDASITDNEHIGNVTAYIKIGDSYQNVTLKDDDRDSIYSTVLENSITDVGDDYIIVDDGKFTSTLQISPASPTATPTETPTATPTETPTDNTLYPNQRLNRDQFLASNNGCFKLILQDDGNLVLYQNVDNAIWSSATNGIAVEHAIMQNDGNFVLYKYDNNPAWASNTDGRDGSRLIVQDDGNVVIYTPTNRSVWATNTVRSCS